LAVFQFLGLTAGSDIRQPFGNVIIQANLTVKSFVKSLLCHPVRRLAKALINKLLPDEDSNLDKQNQNLNAIGEITAQGPPPAGRLMYF
jgi:hypothetical protein